MVRETVTITNAAGLHARPASVFVQQAGKFKSGIKLMFKGNEYNAKSILAIMGAAIKSGSEVEIVCEGEDEQEALSTLKELIESGLGE